MVFTLAAMSLAVSRLSSFIRVAAPWAEALPFHSGCLSRNKLSPAHLQLWHDIAVVFLEQFYWFCCGPKLCIEFESLSFSFANVRPVAGLKSYIMLYPRVFFWQLVCCNGSQQFFPISARRKHGVMWSDVIMLMMWLKGRDYCIQNGEKKVLSVGPCCALHCVAPAASWHVVVLPRTVVAKLPANDSACANIQSSIAKWQVWDSPSQKLWQIQYFMIFHGIDDESN